MKLSEMNETELKNLFEKSEWLRDKVRESFMGNCCDEYLYNIPHCCSYQIGSYCQGEHFKINSKDYYHDLTYNEIESVKSWLDDLQNRYGFISDAKWEIVEEWYQLANAYREQLDDDDILEIDPELEKEYTETENELNRIIYKRLQSEYDQYLDDDCLFECFTDCIDDFDYIEIETDGNNYYTVEKRKIA